MGSKHTRTMLNFAYTLCSSAMFVSDVLGVGYGQVFCVQCLFVLRVARKHGLVQARGPRVTVVFLTLDVLAQGGGGVGLLRKHCHHGKHHKTCTTKSERQCGVTPRTVNAGLKQQQRNP